jgi:hypothetical protein
MTSVAILGAGPSALVAAQAVATYGETELAIFCPMEKSTVWGAQYLHQPIPGVLSLDPKVIRYSMQGTPEDYLKKVYGDRWDGHISDDLRDQAHCAWDLRASYDILWDQFYGSMNMLRFVENTRVNFENVKTLQESYDIVVNTIPRKVFCMNRHQHRFDFTEIWAMGDSDKQRVPVNVAEGMILYQGSHETAWYRASRIFGYSTVEWPHNVNRPPIPGVQRVRKPINHNCDCMPGVKHLGRMGRWDKNILVHHVYADMQELLMIHEESK